MIEKETGLSRLSTILNYFLLALVGLVCLYPFLYVVLASISDPNQLMKHDFTVLLFPEGFSLKAYEYVFTGDLGTGYVNTLIYVIGGTAISMVLTILGAYVLSRKNYLLKKPLTMMIMFTMYFNGGLIPFYLWINDLGLINSRWAILLPMALSTYNMIVMRTAFAGIPESLLEAARLDGASDVTILCRIILPLSKATLAVVVLYYAVARWNEWMPATMFLQDRSLFPLQVFLREILLTSSADSLVNTAGASTNTTALAETIKYATIVVSTLPILIVYPFVQKYFVSGVMIGGVKE